MQRAPVYAPTAERLHLDASLSPAIDHILLLALGVTDGPLDRLELGD